MNRRYRKTIIAGNWKMNKTPSETKAFAEQFYTQMKLRRCDQAQQLAAGAHGGLPLILQEIFQGQAGPDVKAFVEMQSGIFIAKLRNRLYYLSVIVTMAPALGAFGDNQRHDSRLQCPSTSQSGQAIAITGGVGEALIATAFGLCVAILALAVHAYFTQRLDRIITDMELCFSALETMAEKVGQ